MSSDAGESEREESPTADVDPDASAEDLAAQVELLTEENRRLREEYVQGRRASYRRTALGLFVVGALAAAGAVLFPDARSVLFALAGTGVFGGVLTYFLTPERLLAAATGEQVYAAFAETGRRLVAELGLQDDRVYAPADATGEFGNVRLFVPQRSSYDVPAPAELGSLFVATEDGRERGVAVPPCGGSLFREFERSMTDSAADDPAVLADQLADAAVEGFELATSATADADPDGGRVAFEVAGSAYGSVDRFDHPVASLFGVGLTAGLDAPVTVDVTEGDGDSAFFVTCEWDETAVDADESGESAETATDAETESDTSDEVEPGGAPGEPDGEAETEVDGEPEAEEEEEQTETGPAAETRTD
ncbi:MULTISPECIES: hypothetical protein [Halorussus]|uniref:hypothetical protein n=1 Tax=Halorussus TaxID=1070314 RepID=UPI001F04147A|nr:MULTISPECIES: hypothetical protein [Halorussus]